MSNGPSAGPSDLLNLSPCLGRNLFSDKDGNLLKTGDVVKFQKLADTLEIIAKDGAAAFYRGPIAADLVHDIQAAGISYASGRWTSQPL